MPSQLLTIPNGLTLLRAFGVPAFLYTFLVVEKPLLSFAILAFGALTDYLDGKIARALHQESAFGAAFDPAIDRIYIVSTIVAMAMRGYLPWPIVFLLLARDLWMVIALARYRKVTGRNFTVTYLGKAATFNLLYAFPLLLLQGTGTFKSTTGTGGGTIGAAGLEEFSMNAAERFVHTLGWAFAIWGIALYLFTAWQYSREAFRAE